MAITSQRLLVADAKNRSLRSFIQGIGFDILAAIALVLFNALSDANDWSQLDWTVIGFLLVKSVGVAAASYVMRATLDGSSIPTPLPPEPVAEPAEPAE